MLLQQVDDHYILQVSGDDVYVVLNAGCRDKDIEHINNHVKKLQVNHNNPRSRGSSYSSHECFTKAQGTYLIKIQSCQH